MPSPGGHALGVDFGTSHTVAVVRWPDGRARPLLVDGSPLLPSAVYAEPGGALVAGRDAVHSARLDPARFEPNPKRRIDDGTVLLGEREVPVTDLISAVLSRVVEECRRTVGDVTPTVTLTCPATWGATRRTALSDAAAAAGLPGARLVAEPVAATTYFAEVLGRDVPLGSVVVVHDFGAGTFDASVVVRRATGFEVLAVDGCDDVGGVDVDAALVEHLRAGYESRDPAAWQRLASPSTVEDRRAKRQLWDDVRVAKERLSRAQRADLVIPLLDLEVHLTREELELRARPLLERTVRVTEGLIRWARLAEGSVAGVFLVGGSSRIPLLATLLHRALGEAPVVIEQPEMVVAEGSILAEAALLVSAPAAPGPTALLPRLGARTFPGTPAAPVPGPSAPPGPLGSSVSPGPSGRNALAAGRPRAALPAAAPPAAGLPAVAASPPAGAPPTGAPSAGASAAGPPVAGAPSAGAPSAGAPSAGVFPPAPGMPAAGTPSAGASSSAAGTHPAGAPAAASSGPGPAAGAAAAPPTPLAHPALPAVPSAPGAAAGTAPTTPAPATPTPTSPARPVSPGQPVLPARPISPGQPTPPVSPAAQGTATPGPTIGRVIVPGAQPPSRARDIGSAPVTPTRKMPRVGPEPGGTMPLPDRARVDRVRRDQRDGAQPGAGQQSRGQQGRAEGRNAGDRVQRDVPAQRASARPTSGPGPRTAGPGRNPARPQVDPYYADEPYRRGRSRGTHPLVRLIRALFITCFLIAVPLVAGWIAYQLAQRGLSW